MKQGIMKSTGILNFPKALSLFEGQESWLLRASFFLAWGSGMRAAANKRLTGGKD